MITIVLITGASGSGKSSLAKSLAQTLKDGVTTKSAKEASHPRNPDTVIDTTCTTKKVSSSSSSMASVKLFQQDDYFILPFLPYNERKDLTYEGDSGIDWNKLQRDIEAFALPLSSSADTMRQDDRVIIVEGHMLGAAASMLYRCCTNHAYPRNDKEHAGEEICNVHETENGPTTTIERQIHGPPSILSIIVQCSAHECKRRRLERRQRTQEEWDELNSYIDNFVWPGYEMYGIPALESIRTCHRQESEYAGFGSSNETKRNVKLMDIRSDLHSLEHNLGEVLAVLLTLLQAES